MLCSARELGLGEDHDGLLTLDTDAAPGTPLTAVLDGGDERLVIDVTPNRPDLLGHKGVARELAASLGVPFRLPEIPGEASLDLPTPARFGDEAPVGGIRLAIDDRDGCGRLPRGGDSRRQGRVRRRNGCAGAWRRSACARSTTWSTRPTTSCSS